MALLAALACGFTAAAAADPLIAGLVNGNHAYLLQGAC